MLIDRDDPVELLEALRSHVSTYDPKWIDEVI
jgi:hypothetical protein